MDRGHVKLWRKSIDSGLLQNPNLWTFWCWCLMKASWKEYQTIINFQVVKLMPGQFIFGRDSASNELGMSVRTIRTCVDKLKNMQNLTIKTTNRYSIISITNWDIYQGHRPADDQQNDQQTTNRRPTDDHKQEVKEVKEIKDLSPKLSDYDQEIVSFVTLYQENALKEFGNTAPKFTESLVFEGTKTIDRIIRLDKFLKQTVFETIRWAYKDSFWSKQIRSLACLRGKSKNGLTKFQNVYNAMLDAKNTGQSSAKNTGQNIPEYHDFNFEELR